MKIIFFCLLPLINVGGDVLKNKEEKELGKAYLRVGLKINSSLITLQSLSPIEVSLPAQQFISKNLRINLSKELLTDIENNNTYRLPKLITFSPTFDNFIKLNNIPYPGKIEVRRWNDNWEVINIVEVEDYVAGVVAEEMSPLWPEEALAAQAIVGRTYALASLNRHPNSPFHLCNTTHCQVYFGWRRVNPNVIKAIEKTYHMVLFFTPKQGGESEIAKVIYHACCGGYTEDAFNTWGREIPYLKAKPCNFCFQAPAYKNGWYFHLPYDKFFKILDINPVYYDKKQQTTLTIIPSYNKSGRVQELHLQLNSNGEIINFSISGYKLRQKIGENLLLSTKFKIYASEGEIIFEGIGRGHGLGMCQWGAKYMAELGYSYKDILEFYYPGTEIKLVRFIS
jgi:stage II sporulation protein D